QEGYHPLQEKKDKYRTRNWKEYSAPQAHGQGEKNWTCKSYMRDEGRPFEAGLQELASNHSKLL
ncbi:MAG TPA: hypothetical protein PKW79_04180, partial [Rhabdochlamydiaceae bacterium]|nr:hypothetical protein [Rhabdochlamydiaceae bacterium]